MAAPCPCTGLIYVLSVMAAAITNNIFNAMLAVNSSVTSEKIPLLENGDYLTRPEFERRYTAMPSVKKAELIERIVYMSSPVRVSYHGRPHAIIMTWLGTYWTATPGVDLCDNTTVRLDFDNEPQPDAVLRIDGGNSRIDEDDYIAGAPELIVEVSASSISQDMNDKLKAYQRNGVQEYLVWQVKEQKIAWSSLKLGSYVSLLADERGIIRSEMFPGLWLDEVALLGGDLVTVISTLQEGLQSAGHQTFREHLSGL